MSAPTLIDCDPGTDDALALLLAFGSPELDLRAITVVGGNLGLDRTLPNADGNGFSCKPFLVVIAHLPLFRRHNTGRLVG